MSGIETLLIAGSAAFRLGNPLVAVDQYVAAVESAGPIDRRRLLSALTVAVTEPTLRLTAHARLALAARIGDLRVHIASAEVDALIAAIECVPTPPNQSGQMIALLVAEPTLCGASYGLARVLKIDAEGWEGRTQLKHNCENVPWNGFGIAAWAARRFVLDLGGGRPGLAQMLFQRSISGEFPGLGREFAVRGESLALPAAIAAVAALLGQQVSGEVAASGALDHDGTLRAVTGLEFKLRAAAEYGVAQVVLPRCLLREASALCARLRLDLVLVPANTLAEAVSAVLSSAQLEQGRDVLARAMEYESASGPDTVPTNCGLLLGCVGRSDPVGHLLDKNRRPEATEDGPTLQLVRRLRPRRIVLFHTVGPGAANDYGAKTQALADLIAGIDATCKVDPYPLDEIDDPTDFAQLYLGLGRGVKACLADEGSEPLAVNVSSGTAQMLVTWLLLRERGVLPPGAALLQVRESRYLPANEPPIRCVRLPGALGNEVARAKSVVTDASAGVEKPL